jgi:hypothetical protein
MDESAWRTLFMSPKSAGGNAPVSRAANAAWLVFEHGWLVLTQNEA